MGKKVKKREADVSLELDGTLTENEVDPRVVVLEDKVAQVAHDLHEMINSSSDINKAVKTQSTRITQLVDEVREYKSKETPIHNFVGGVAVEDIYGPALTGAIMSVFARQSITGTTFRKAKDGDVGSNKILDGAVNNVFALTEMLIERAIRGEKKTPVAEEEEQHGTGN